MSTKPNLLLIGINGFIGSHIARLLKHQYQITGVAGQKHPEIHTICVDKNAFEPKLCFKNQSYDFCINAGGSASVGWSIAHPEEDYLLNVVNTEKLLEAILDQNPDCRLIQLSSAAVYGNPEYLPVKEDHPLKPISPYGRHKMQSEQLLSYSSVKNLNLRIFSAYGPGLQKQLFWDVLQKTKKGNEIALFGTGNETRDFIFIDDLVQAVNLVMKKADFDGSSINVASGKSNSISTAVDYLIEHYYPELIVKYTASQKTGDPLHWEANISKLKSLGFEPTFNLNAGLKEYAFWFRNKFA
jgi:UDP-glucose 4-epimerase